MPCMSLRAVSGIGTTLRRLSFGKAFSSASIKSKRQPGIPKTRYFHRPEEELVPEFEPLLHLHHG